MSEAKRMQAPLSMRIMSIEPSDLLYYQKKIVGKVPMYGTTHYAYLSTEILDFNTLPELQSGDWITAMVLPIQSNDDDFHGRSWQVISLTKDKRKVSK